MLDVESVSKTFAIGGRELLVLADVSLRLPDGGRLAIMGPSGSGKSTLLAIVAGLEPPSGGRVRLDGVDPHAGDARTRARFRARRVGFVFQEHHLLAGCTALDNVVMPALADGTAPGDVIDRAGMLLERVGLAGRRDHFPGELSGGERQRVAIARALLRGPRLVVADEPTGQLDSRTAAEVAELLVELTAEAGGILLVATHAEDVARRLGAVRRLVDGRLEP